MRPPYSIAAASSCVTAAGAIETLLSSFRHAYSAYAPKRSLVNAHTRSPGRKRVTALPASTTSPERIRPMIRLRGRRRPTRSRNGTWTLSGDIGTPLRTYQSLELTVEAWIRTRISSGAGIGASTSATRRTSGGP